MLWPKAWYYHTGYKPRTVANLMELYYTSIGRGSPLNLGLAINPEGKVSKSDSLALINFKKQVDLAFETDLISNAKLTASNFRENSKTYKPKQCADQSTETYWATDDGIQKAYLEVDFGKEKTFNCLLLQENIALGQRIHSFWVEMAGKDGWKEIHKGTTIGYKRVLKFDDAVSRKVRITFETEAPCLTLSNLGIFNAPPLIKDPDIRNSVDGTISLHSEENHQLFFKTGNDDFQEYLKPFALPKGGIVSAYAIDKLDKYKSELVSQEFGVAKDKWRIQNASSETSDYLAQSAIDGDSFTSWVSEEEETDNFIAIDLGKTIPLTGFSYLPCKRGCAGTIYEYEFYTSLDGKNWESPVSLGEFSNIQNNPTEQIIKFVSTVQAKYVKLVSKSAIKDSKQMSAAEIGIFTN